MGGGGGANKAEPADEIRHEHQRATFRAKKCRTLTNLDFETQSLARVLIRRGEAIQHSNINVIVIVCS